VYSGFGFQGGKIGLAECPFADHEECAVFGCKVIVDGGGGEGDGFGGLGDDVEGESSGVVAVPGGLEK
jgi:hypothetical protein